MEDDGIVLNLTFESPARRPKAANKVGDRKEKHNRSNRDVRGTKRKERPVDAGPSDAATDAGRPSKKPRVSFADDPEHGASKPPTKAPGRSGQFISSLFTYNPEIVAPQDETPSAPQGKPSNAPLADSSTFSGLGLHPLLVSHLHSKHGIDKPMSIQRATLSSLNIGHSEDLDSPRDSDSQRDIFIQSQTGSGKTLSYLLPIVQDLLPLSTLSYIDRSIGTLAIILAPTRELAKQISDVLEKLLSLRLSNSSEDDAEDEANSPHLTRWLVSGLLTGGATRTHEKARLRKGVPILVSTPGRLLDHLQNTSSFNVGKCRWLVLDEADRLMDLGFEETITGILRCLDGRRKLATQAAEAGSTADVGGWDWSKTRRTILCSATMREDVQKLAGVALRNPILVKGAEGDENDSIDQKLQGPVKDLSQANKFTPPSQLAQKYVIVPLKLRLVTLVALLRSLLARASSGDGKIPSSKESGTRIIVFVSCTDAVDFIWTLLGGARMGDAAQSAASNGPAQQEREGSDTSADDGAERASKQPDPLDHRSSLLPNTSLFRLHGSLPLQTRMASLQAFAAPATRKKNDTSPAPSTSAILFCTSVASRGLDLPRVQAVIQYDLPSEGGATEYIHRVGRTARVGRGGEAWAIVSPSEAEWVPWVEKKMAGEGSHVGSRETGAAQLRAVTIEEVLRSGFGGRKTDHEARATQVQLAFERWVLSRKEHAALARKAFSSHVRAYATHPSDEKHLFHVRNLHLGHLAKSFALREAPGTIGGGTGSGKGGNTRQREAVGQQGHGAAKPQPTVESRMRKAVRKQQFRRPSASEFQVPASGLIGNLAGNA